MISIQSAFKKYEVHIHKDFNQISFSSVQDNTFIVIDRHLYELYREELFSEIPNDHMYLLDAVEDNKVIDTALEICERMTELSAKRNAVLISFGGGIIQDITGFVASVLYRGIKWIFYPTTLLAGCDSCIGGKTSLNYKSFKNLLGTFYPPDQIHICIPFFSTLSDRDFMSGLGEVVKFNVMQGKEGIHRIDDQITHLLDRDTDSLYDCILSSLEYKKGYIEADEFDRGVRIHLNFAHTFGHALETTSHYNIPHGTAVAMGTIMANRISCRRNWIDNDTAIHMDSLLKTIISPDYLTANITVEEMLPAIKKDKKQTDDSITAVLLRGDELKPEIIHNLSVAEIIDALEHLKETVKKS